MIRFKQFLEAQETPYDVEVLEVVGIIQALKEHCTDSIKAGEVKMWRGSRTAHRSGVFHPDTGKRRSENSANYYTLLLDSNTQNAAFPERSRSFIGSTSRASAMSYNNGRGSIMALFPFNSTKVGVVNESDIWRLKLEFPRSLKMTESLTGMNEFWRGFMEAIDEADLIPTMKQLQARLRNHPEEALAELRAANYVDVRDDDKRIIAEFIDELPDAYSFENMGCEVVFPREVEAERSEIWLSGPCVAVVEADLAEVKKELGW